MSDPLWIGAGIGEEVGTGSVDTDGEWTLTDHGLTDGQPVRLDELTGGANGPFAEDTTYYVVNAATDTFELVSIPGDTVIEPGSSGGADVHTAAPHYSAGELRRAQSMFLFKGVGDRFGAREGVHPSNDPPVSLSGTTWTVEDLTAVVYPRLTSNAGPYVVQHSEESGSLDPADGSNDRIDALDLQIQDDDEDSSGQRRARVVYTAGTPAADPDPPSAVSNALRLATIDVPAGGSPSPSIDTEAQLTVAAGGVLPVRDSDELPSAGRYDGMAAWDQDAEALVVRHDGEWRTVAGVAVACRATLDSDQSIPNNSDTDVEWDTFQYNHGGFSFSSGDVQVPVAGVYAITAGLYWEGDGAGWRRVEVLAGGTQIASQAREIASGIDQGVTTATEWELDAGEVVNVQARHNAGNEGGSSNLDVLADNETFLTVRLVART